MIYAEVSERSTALAEEALEHMRSHDIAANPQNFTIWYEYFAGTNEQLNRSLHVLLENDQEFTDLRNEEIFNEFFATGTRVGQVHAWGERIEAAASKILETLAQSETGTEKYGQTLQNFSGEIEGTSDIAEIQKFVAGIVAETKTMEAQMETLQADVAASTTEITTLRENLESAQRDAMTDGLTGLANRKCFDAKLKEAALDALETGEPLCLVMADLDYFKKFNDAHGHLMGDQVLRLVGRMLIQSLKGLDTAARYGGEEFALILPSTDIRGAASAAENIRHKVSTKKLVKKGTEENYGPITMSMGVTCYAPGESLSETIRRADAALYNAKSLGRNRVVSDERVPQPAAAPA